MCVCVVAVVGLAVLVAVVVVVVDVVVVEGVAPYVANTGALVVASRSMSSFVVASRFAFVSCHRRGRFITFPGGPTHDGRDRVTDRFVSYRCTADAFQTVS